MLQLLQIISIRSPSSGIRTCRCYLLEQWGSMRISEVTIDDRTSCSQLGYSQINPFDSSYRYCCDPDLPLLDTIELVIMFWD